MLLLAAATFVGLPVVVPDNLLEAVKLACNLVLFGNGMRVRPLQHTSRHELRGKADLDQALLFAGHVTAWGGVCCQSCAAGTGPAPWVAKEQ